MHEELVALLTCKSALSILLLRRRAFCFATGVHLHVSSRFLLRNACPSVRLKAKLVSKIDMKIDTKIDPKSVPGAAPGLPKST